MDRPRKRNADGSPDSRTLKKPCIVIDERAEDGDAENDLVEQLSREGFGVQVCQAFKGSCRGSTLYVTYTANLDKMMTTLLARMMFILYHAFRQ